MDESRQKKKEEKRMAGGVRWSNEQSPKCFTEERKEMGKEGGVYLALVPGSVEEECRRE